MVITDRYCGYHWVDPERRQLCWSHLNRDFQAMVDRGGASKAVGEALLWESDRMFRWCWRVKDGCHDRAWFQRKLKAVMKGTREALERGETCDHTATEGTCRDILERFVSLWTFARVEGVERILSETRGRDAPRDLTPNPLSLSGELAVPLIFRETHEIVVLSVAQFCFRGPLIRMTLDLVRSVPSR